MTTLYSRHTTATGRHRYTAWGDSAGFEGLPNGHYLISVEDGKRSACQLHNPDLRYAELLAAAQVAQEAMLNAMREQSRERLPPSRRTSARERRAWRAYCKAVGDPKGIVHIEIPAAHEIVRAGIQALLDAANQPKP